MFGLPLGCGQIHRRQVLSRLLSTAIAYTLGLGFLTVPGTAAAGDAERTIAEYLHTGWAVADGAPSGVHGFAQTTDGYLWLASTNGLFRFDGVRFERYQPTQGDSLQFRDISAVFATADGGLWIGRTGRAIFLKNGRAVTYDRDAGFALATVFRFAADRDGTIWAATSRGLMRFDRSRWSRLDREWKFSAESATDLFFDGRGNLWVTAPGALFFLSSGRRAFTMREMTGPWMIREAADRTLWMSEYNAGIRSIDGPPEQLAWGATLRLPGGPREILLSRDGSMWFSDQGIARIRNADALHAGHVDVPNAVVEHFAQKDGLTADSVVTTFEDREGNIWVATTAGIDRFRRRNVIPGPFPFDGQPLALVADAGGTVLAANNHSLLQLRDGKVSVRAALQSPASYHFTRPSIRCAFQDADDATWLGGRGVLTRVTGGVAENIALPSDLPAGGQWDVQAITRDHGGDLWVSIQRYGVFRRHHGVWQRFGQKEPPSGEVRSPVTLWTDAHGRVWLGYVGTRVRVVDGEKIATYSTDDMGIGTVTFIGGHGDRVWIVGHDGLALFDGNGFRTILGEADGEFWGIGGVVEAANGDLWLNQGAGLAHIDAGEIANRLQDPSHKLRYELFDFHDGMPSGAATSGPLPSAVWAGDGRIWLSGSNGTYWIDPARLYRNPLPPPIRIEAIYADDRRYDASGTSQLAELPSNVRIEYTALSLSLPDRVLFRYHLEGVDRDWQDAGTRRAAYYTKLPPGRFRFHVVASNNDGVWNETGASLDFSIAPAYYQTAWFRTVFMVAALALAWAMYRFRVRQLAHQFDARLQERVNERTRIARELHDTLLQSFHGVMFRFQAAANVLPERPQDAKQQLETALKQGTRAIREGRDAVQGLRASTTATNDLAVALTTLGDELAASQPDEPQAHTTGLDVAIEGTPRSLRPIVRDDIYRIGGEAMRNAIRHAGAHRIEVELRYDARQFQLRVRDDGQGIDGTLLRNPRAGHFGLRGMRERAELIGGRFEIWSEAGLGTEVVLTISAVTAYADPPVRSRLWRFGRRTHANEERQVQTNL